MSELHELLEDIKKHREKFGVTKNSSEADKLRNRIMTGKKTNEEWLQLREDVVRFAQSNASKEDKKMLSGYTESLSMICSAIDEGRL